MTIKTTLLATLVAVTGGAGAVALAQTAAVENPGVTVPANVLSVGDIEARLTSQGIKVKEIEVRDLLAEVDAFDAQGREIELVIDRRNGETLSHEFDR
jgi:hypothetical protein